MAKRGLRIGEGRFRILFRVTVPVLMGVLAAVVAAGGTCTKPAGEFPGSSCAAGFLFAEMHENDEAVFYGTIPPEKDRSPEEEEERRKQEKAWEMLKNMSPRLDMRGSRSPSSSGTTSGTTSNSQQQ